VTALILQGRLDSTRLPRKSLLPLDGEPLVYRVMEALSCVPCDIRVLACPEDCETQFRPLAEKAGFDICTGSKEDVLARYCTAIRRYSPDRVIRATADNPFVFVDAAEKIAAEAAALNAAYACYAGIPVGTGVEAVSAEALLRAEKEGRRQTEREHVCPYLYGHPELFRLHRPLALPEWQGPEIRLTVDTPEDFRRAENIYRILSEKTSGKDRYMGKEILKAAAP